MTDTVKTTAATRCEYPPQHHPLWPHLEHSGVYYFGRDVVWLFMIDASGNRYEFMFSAHCDEAAQFRPEVWGDEMARPAGAPARRPSWWRRLASWFAGWIGGAS